MANQNDMILIAFGAIGQHLAIHMLADLDVGATDLCRVSSFRTRLQNRLTHFTGHIVCNLFTIAVDEVTELIQDLSSLEERHLFPGRLRIKCSIHHFRNLLAGIIWNTAYNLTGRFVDDIHHLHGFFLLNSKSTLFDSATSRSPY